MPHELLVMEVVLISGGALVFGAWELWNAREKPEDSRPPGHPVGQERVDPGRSEPVER